MSTTTIINESWDAEDRLPSTSQLWTYIDNPVDLSFADPPYNIGVDYEDDHTGDSVSDSHYQYWCNQIIRKLAGMTKHGGVLFWLCPAEHGSWIWQTMIRYGKLLHGKPIIWYERFSQYQAKRLTSDYRLLFPLVIDGGPHTFNPDSIREESVRQQMNDKRANPAGRVPGHVWTVSRLQGNHPSRIDWHPAQLPPLALARIVEGWTNKGETVLDAFAGAGSLGVVCRGLNRNFVGVEQSAMYCDKMIDRINTAPSTFIKPKRGHV